jgi:hypothetical protein
LVVALGAALVVSWTVIAVPVTGVIVTLLAASLLRRRYEPANPQARRSDDHGDEAVAGSLLV